MLHNKRGLVPGGKRVTDEQIPLLPLPMGEAMTGVGSRFTKQRGQRRKGHDQGKRSTIR